MGHTSLVRGTPMGVGIVLLALFGAGCGSSNSSSSSAKAAHHPAAAHIYRLKLTGAAERPPGAPNASGSAVVAFHGHAKVCWRFAHLKGFSGATFAHIHHGAKGKSGPIVVPLSTAPKLRHKGCVSAAPAVVLPILKDPPGYYVNVHSAKYPGGAVRAQL